MNQEKIINQQNQSNKYPIGLELFSIVLIVGGLALDLFTKYTIKDKTIIEGIISFSVTQNTGLAFSFLSNVPYVPLILNIVMFILLLILWRIEKLQFLTISIGGALGNLLERIIFGHVTDFIKILHFPIFNVADILITVGISLTILNMFGVFKIFQNNRKDVENKVKPN
jgi:signal peptidase II